VRVSLIARPGQGPVDESSPVMNRHDDANERVATHR
jgi:hypothetical protein